MSTYTTSPLPLYNTCQVLMMVGRHSPIVLTYWSVTTSFASDDHKDSLRESIVRRVKRGKWRLLVPTCHCHVSLSRVIVSGSSGTPDVTADISHWSTAGVYRWYTVDFKNRRPSLIHSKRKSLNQSRLTSSQLQQTTVAHNRTLLPTRKLIQKGIIAFPHELTKYL